MSVRNIFFVLLLLISFLLVLIYLPSLFVKDNANTVEVFWNERKDKDYIIYAEFVPVWDDFQKRSAEYFREKPSLFFWYNHRFLELALFYLHVGKIYDRFIYEIAEKYPGEFGVFRQVNFMSLKPPLIKELDKVPFEECEGGVKYYYYRSYQEIGKQYLKSVYEIGKKLLPGLPQFSLADIDLLLLNMEIAATLKDTEYVKYCIKLLDSYYSREDLNGKEEFWMRLYNDKSYKFYQLYKSFTFIDLNRTTFFKDWTDEYDDVIGKIYSFVHQPEKRLPSLFSFIDDDPVTMEHYAYIIPDICSGYIDDGAGKDLSVREKELVFSYISHCITKSGTDRFRLDYILLPIIYNSDRLDYMGVVLGELNKVKQYSRLQMLGPLIEVISRVMIKMTGKLTTQTQ